MSSSTDPIEWFRYPFVATDALAKAWLTTEMLLGLAPNTLDAYARGLDDFLGFCQKVSISPAIATRADLARYVGDLRSRPRSSTQHGLQDHAPTMGLSNATLQQRLTAVRLFFDFLIEEGKRVDHPVGRGRYTPGKSFGADRERALVPRFQTLPWIPSEEQWRAFLAVVKQAPLRTRCMAALAYDAGLRREEVCSLRSDDLDPAHRMVRVRAEVAKGSRERVVPYSATTGELLRAYLAHRRTIAHTRGPLFLSESPRNFAQPITLWTWSKVVRKLALSANLPQFSTHTFRHLCLTDLARSGWELHQIAEFAGHRNPATTLLYIHLSGHDLAEQFTRGMSQIHAWRMQMIARAFGQEPLSSEEASAEPLQSGQEAGSFYPLEMLRALAVVWLFAGLRSDELSRLRVGCARQQTVVTGEQPEEKPVCLLDIPVHKTGRAFTKPVDPLVGEAIAAWEAVRPAQPDLIDPKTSEQVQFLFCYRAKRLSKGYLNKTLIPALCQRAGIPRADTRGSISSQRARSTIASQLFNAREPMTLFELQAWLGHQSPATTQHYVLTSPTKLAQAYKDAGYFSRNVRAIEVLIDQNAITSGAAASGTPWRYYDLGHGWCSYEFFDQCPHRMACARCDFYVPKESDRGLWLQTRDGLLKLLQEIPLSDEERAAVDGDVQALDRLLDQLKDVPTPSQVSSQKQHPFIPLHTIRSAQQER